MAKTPVNLRLDAALLRRIDEYAERRLSNRTAVVQAACLAFLEDAGAGVPDLPAVNEQRSAPRNDQVSVPAPSDAWLRQQRLNEAKYGRGKR